MGGPDDGFQPDDVPLYLDCSDWMTFILWWWQCTFGG